MEKSEKKEEGNSIVQYKELYSDIARNFVWFEITTTGNKRKYLDLRTGATYNTTIYKGIEVEDSLLESFEKYGSKTDSYLDRFLTPKKRWYHKIFSFFHLNRKGG